MLIDWPAVMLWAAPALTDMLPAAGGCGVAPVVAKSWATVLLCSSKGGRLYVVTLCESSNVLKPLKLKMRLFQSL